VAFGLLTIGMASPVLADHGLAPVTSETRCHVAVAEASGGTVLVTGHLVDPPSFLLVLTFDSAVEPLSLASVYRGTHAHISLDFDRPPDIGTTSFPVLYQIALGTGGTNFRFAFRTTGVGRLTVTGSMEAGPECHASLALDGLPDTGSEPPGRRPAPPSGALLLAVGVGALLAYGKWFSRSGRPPAD
jgi:hypothetical protein